MLLHTLGERYPAILERHHSLMRAAFRACNGRVVKRHGDSFFAVFERAADAVAAAVAAQRALAAEPWPVGSPVRVRIGLHTGQPTLVGSDYVGIDVHRGARLMAAGHGGQVLLSATTQSLVAEHMPAGVMLRDWGTHRLKDLPHPEHIYQLVMAGLVNDFPPLETVDNRPHNLPAQLTALIGREREVEAACALLRRSDLRLLTLTGTGGTGKTRLSLEVAAQLLADFEDGVFRIELAAISDPDLLLPSIAQTLGVRERAGQSLHESLHSHLATSRVLLVLDNFEQIIEAASIVTQLMGACARLKVLVTSRKALHVRGEQEFPVSPLALPDLANLPEAVALAQYAAVRLFIERAVAVRPDFAVTDANAAAVAEICTRLDGLPLAIELAAARTRLFAPSALLARLGNRLQFLTGGARDLPERHQTLEAAISWSYNLLDDRQQELLRRLAVFSGGCTAEAAAAICTADGAGVFDGGVLDGLESLVAENLLQQDNADEPRFWMLETIREFALAKLEASGERDAMQRRHAVYYSALSQDLERKLWGPQQVEFRRRMMPEQENLRAALHWSLDEEPELAVPLAVLGPRHAATLTEARDSLERTLKNTQGASPTVRLDAAITAANVAVTQGDFAAAQNHLEATHALIEEATKKSLLSDENRRASTANVLYWLSLVAMNGGDFVTARALAEERIQVLDGDDDPRTRLALAEVNMNEGNFAAARAYYEEYTTQHRASLSHSNLSSYLVCLGQTMRFQGDYEQAIAAFQQSLALERELGRRPEWLTHSLGWAARYQNDYERAATLFKESLIMAREGGQKRGLINAIIAVAGMNVLQGQPLRAVRLFGAVESILPASGMVLYAGDRADLERDLAIARVTVDTDDYAAAWAAGCIMTISQAVEYSLAV